MGFSEKFFGKKAEQQSAGSVDRINVNENTENIPEYMVPKEADHSLPGYLEIVSEIKTLRRAIDLDFRYEKLCNLTALHEEVAQHIDKINENRSEKISPNTTDEKLLVLLVRPEWNNFFPDGQMNEDQAKQLSEYKSNLDPAEVGKMDEKSLRERQWDEFKTKFGENIQNNLEELRILNFKVEQLKDDTDLQSNIEKATAERLNVLKITAAFRVGSRNQKRLSKEIAMIRINAGNSDRPLTKVERRLIEQKTALMKEIGEHKGAGINTEEIRDDVQKEAVKADLRDKRRQLESGLMMTGQMEEIINESLPAMSRGEPTLFVGDTGGAKTALAEYMAKQYFDGVEFVSGHGSADTYQMIGKANLINEGGVTVSGFSLGPVARAMENGVPLVLDELNALPAELLKRLNRIMQMRPGDKFKIQEDNGKEILIKPGFCIIATLNEKSKRYKGVDNLSAEFKNRFGANVYRVEYPDSKAAYDQDPTENYALALASIIEHNGEVPLDIVEADVKNLAKAARVSQQIFSGEHGNGYKTFLEKNQIGSNQPGLEEEVLAPRTVVDLLRKVVGSYGQLTIDQALVRFVQGIKNEQDRKVMTNILIGHGFLKDLNNPQTAAVPPTTP